MHVKNVQHHLLSDGDVAAQASTAFAAPPGYVVVDASANRQPAQRQIAVTAPVQFAVFTKATRVAAQFFRDTPNLIELAAAIFNCQNLLDGYHVSVQLANH